MTVVAISEMIPTIIFNIFRVNLHRFSLSLRKYKVIMLFRFCTLYLVSHTHMLTLLHLKNAFYRKCMSEIFCLALFSYVILVYIIFGSIKYNIYFPQGLQKNRKVLQKKKKQKTGILFFY